MFAFARLFKCLQLISNSPDWFGHGVQNLFNRIGEPFREKIQWPEDKVGVPAQQVAPPGEPAQSRVLVSIYHLVQVGWREHR